MRINDISGGARWMYLGLCMIYHWWVQSLFDIANAVTIFCGSDIENLILGLMLQLPKRTLHIMGTHVVPTCQN
jgi:hypothetical protein